jgi:hypothetical protein
LVSKLIRATIAQMKKYKFPALSDILKVKVGTKYVWEDRVKNQTMLVHQLEDLYGIKMNISAFSFYPNYLYFGMPITNHPNIKKSLPLWRKVEEVFTKNRWKVYPAYKSVNPRLKIPKDFDTFEDLGFHHVQLLLSELVLMDMNYPSHGVGQQIQLSAFQPLIAFSKDTVSRMVYGRPGSLIIKYEKDEDLLNILGDISKRKSYQKEPFYIRRNSSRHLMSVYKGKTCLNLKIKDSLQKS